MGTKRQQKRFAAQSKLNTEAKMIGIIEYGRIHDYDPMIKDMIIKDFLSFIFPLDFKVKSNLYR